MYRDDDGRLVLSPTDLVGYLHCPHLTELSLAVANGMEGAPARDDPAADLLRRKGDEHEKAWLAQLEAQGKGVRQIPADGSLAERARLTRQALADGVDTVYQATFVGEEDGASWRGHADFVMRVDGEPSELGSYSYHPADTKLARRVTPEAVLQLSEYAGQLEAVQGTEVSRISVVLGDERQADLRRRDFAAYHRSIRRRFVAALGAGITAEPLPVPHCAVCEWAAACDERRLRTDHLTVVAGLGRDPARKLQAAGVPTMTALAQLSDDAVSDGVKGVGPAFLARLREQARLQVASAAAGDGPPRYELLAAGEPGVGLGALPVPSTGDLFFDIEGDPWFALDGLEYLFGVGWVSGDAFAYRAFWAHDRTEEKAAFEALVDFIVDRRRAHPDMHVYHFADYESAALGKLMGRHGTREAEIDDLLRGNVLVDLYRVVRQAVLIGTPSYSLKKIERLYQPSARTEAITDGGSSVVEYEHYIESGDPGILARLAEYNEADCASTRGLRDWLEDRRPEFASRFGAEPARPEPGRDQAPEAVALEMDETAELAEALRAVDPADPTAPGRALLADLLSWHRREEKPEWWRYYDRALRCDERNLYDDTEAVAMLEFVDSEPDGRSTIYRYRFDPEQECKLSVGQPVLDPAQVRQDELGVPEGEAPINPKTPGTLVAFDAGAGTLSLRRGGNRVHPRCLMPNGPVPTKDQKAALRRLADCVVDRGLDGPGPYRAVRDLLLRRPPRLEGGPSAGPLLRPGESTKDGAVRLATSLCDGVLAVQGPPGSGKTSAAARMVVDLVALGRRVGVTAHSHSVIGNLVTAILAEARRRETTLAVTQKPEPGGKGVEDAWVTIRRDVAGVIADVDDGVPIVAGTSWLFSDELLEGRFDVLVVDEAGQQSLANTVAAGTSAHNLVLVGDPRQLPQPSKGSHPPGAEASALGHVLGGAPTMPADLGVFLDHTHRLHPDICAFVSEVIYDDKLLSDEGCARQAVDGEDGLSGSGLRWLPVEHDDDRVRSADEAAAVDACFRSLVGRTVTESSGQRALLTAERIMVVAPYNAQVAELSARLPEGAQVGTVDRFQGREADVVLVSLTTSSAEQIPRGMEFLYSHHRLNVAVSRARALVVLVGSPRLLAVDCHTVEQMRLANALCRYVEMAQTISTPSSAS